MPRIKRSKESITPSSSPFHSSASSSSTSITYSTPGTTPPSRTSKTAVRDPDSPLAARTLNKNPKEPIPEIEDGLGPGEPPKKSCHSGQPPFLERLGKPKNHNGNEFPLSTSKPQKIGEHNSLNPFDFTPPYPVWQPFYKSRKTADWTKSKILKYLREYPSNSKQEKEKLSQERGYAYVFTSDFGPHYYKAGVAKHVPARLDRWEKCVGVIKQINHNAKPFPHHYLAESLVSLELCNIRKKYRCANCAQAHGEWYHTTDDKLVLKTVNRWIQWLLSNPFRSDDLRLNDRWSWKVDETLNTAGEIDWEQWTQWTEADGVQYQAYRLQNDLNELQSELSKFQKDIDAVTSDPDRLKDYQELHRLRKKAFQYKMDDLQKRKDELNGSGGQLQDKLDELQSQLTQIHKLLHIQLLTKPSEFEQDTRPVTPEKDPYFQRQPDQRYYGNGYISSKEQNELKAYLLSGGFVILVVMTSCLIQCFVKNPMIIHVEY